MVTGCKDKKKISSCTETPGHFLFFAVSLVIRCMLYYYRYHVVLHFSQLEKNKL